MARRKIQRQMRLLKQLIQPAPSTQPAPSVSRASRASPAQSASSTQPASQQQDDKDIYFSLPTTPEMPQGQNELNGNENQVNGNQVNGNQDNENTGGQDQSYHDEGLENGVPVVQQEPDSNVSSQQQEDNHINVSFPAIIEIPQSQNELNNNGNQDNDNTGDQDQSYYDEGLENGVLGVQQEPNSDISHLLITDNAVPRQPLASSLHPDEVPSLRGRIITQFLNYANIDVQTLVQRRLADILTGELDRFGCTEDIAMIASIIVAAHGVSQVALSLPNDNIMREWAIEAIEQIEHAPFPNVPPTWE
ncbi:hypothetical protein F4777DRAFT_244162 [Nemania sp. FL0916]|nr:hypothetical protein F4777DRAFT_244162 [Nemania sp. FL0916]